MTHAKGRFSTGIERPFSTSASLNSLYQSIPWVGVVTVTALYCESIQISGY
jgi:hypothetical protein